MPKKEKEYPTLITSENMDAVIDLMLDRKDEEEIVHLDYKDVSCLLNISKGQYKNIIEEFKKDGLIEQRGYGDTYKLLYGIHKKKGIWWVLHGKRCLCSWSSKFAIAA